jgi:hypothetical protein
MEIKESKEMSDAEMMYRFFKLSAEIWLSGQTESSVVVPIGKETLEKTSVIRS